MWLERKQKSGHTQNSGTVCVLTQEICSVRYAFSNGSSIKELDSYYNNILMRSFKKRLNPCISFYSEFQTGLKGFILSQYSAS